MKTLIALLLLLSPLFVSAREYFLPSGLKVDIKEPAVTWTFKTWVLPSGLHWVDLIPIARASNVKTFQDDIIQWIRHYAKLYNISEDGMINLAKCESNFDIDILGDKGQALGLYQWWQKSWDYYNRKNKTELDRDSWQHQIEMTARVLSEKNGWENWYWCWKNKVLNEKWPK